MFEVGFSELLLIGVVALLVLGPERLPRAARMLGLWTRRARASWYSLRAEFEQELSASELKQSLKQGAEQMRQLDREIARVSTEAQAAVQRVADDTAPAVQAPAVSKPDE